tara:strand:- start:126 stop:1172 length:1047 start_codon:yes stop_codon:yes gene_type:complete
MWATPQAMDGLRVNQVRKKEDLTDKAKKGGCSNLREQVIEQPEMWLTPSATNIAKRSEEGMEKREKMRNDRGRKTVPPGSLAEQVDYGYPIKDMKEKDMWSTPTTSDRYSAHMKPNEEGVPHDIAKGNLRGEVQMWPTPRATERMAYHESPSPSMVKGTHGWSLPAAITDEASENPHRMWPTPTGTERSGINPNTGKGAGLSKTVQMLEKQKMWPTPAARDHKDTGENTDYEKLARKSKLSGAVKSEMYPTPRASEVAATITMDAALNRIEKAGYKANLEESVALKEQAKMFLTPGANEDAAGKPTGKMQRMLGNSPEIRNTGKGTLNPDWVEWMMGYPPGWTDIKDS